MGVRFRLVCRTDCFAGLVALKRSIAWRCAWKHDQVPWRHSRGQQRAYCSGEWGRPETRHASQSL